jgi:hypothetical protein
MVVNPSRPIEPTHSEIAALAYQLYEAGGRIDGRDVDDWLEAERRLRPDPTELIFNLYERQTA